MRRALCFAGLEEEDEGAERGKKRQKQGTREYLPGVGTANYAFMIVLFQVRRDHVQCLHQDGSLRDAVCCLTERMASVWDAEPQAHQKGEPFLTKHDLMNRAENLHITNKPIKGQM